MLRAAANKDSSNRAWRAHSLGQWFPKWGSADLSGPVKHFQKNFAYDSCAFKEIRNPCLRVSFFAICAFVVITLPNSPMTSPEVESRTQGSRPRTQKNFEAKAKDRPSRGQGPRTQTQVFSKKKKKGLQKFFSNKFFRQKRSSKNFFPAIST